MIDQPTSTLIARIGHHMAEGAKKLYAAQWATSDDFGYLIELAGEHIRQASENMGELEDLIYERRIMAKVSAQGEETP